MTGGAYPLPGSLCASGAWYRQFGTLVGPDGQAYPLLVPQARDVEANEDAPRWATEDWGPPDGPAVTDLLGGDPGWSTVAVERGAGRLGDDLSPLERLLVGLGGAPAANFLDANGLWPASQDVYPGTTLDAEFNPNFVPIGDRPRSAGPDAVDEIAGVTPVLVEEPSGNVRYELTVPSAPSAVVMGGAAELVTQVATGMGNVRQVEDARNVGFVVEYQVNDDGRTRAIVHTHHIEIDADGEPVVFVGYGGLRADGEPGVVQMVSPRVNGDYAPTYPTNGIEPD
jgi:hypothetical protein